MTLSSQSFDPPNAAWAVAGAMLETRERSVATVALQTLSFDEFRAFSWADVAARAGLPPQTASAIARNLAKRGFLERTKEPGQILFKLSAHPEVITPVAPASAKRRGFEPTASEADHAVQTLPSVLVLHELAARRRETLDAHESASFVCDVDAVRAWFNRPTLSAPSREVYLRESARALMWFAGELGKDLCDVTPQDCAAYRRFIEDIPPRWLSSSRRDAAVLGWSPFVCTPTLKTCVFICAVLSSLFDWLAGEGGHLKSDPWLQSLESDPASVPKRLTPLMVPKKPDAELEAALEVLLAHGYQFTAGSAAREFTGRRKDSAPA